MMSVCIAVCCLLLLLVTPLSTVLAAPSTVRLSPATDPEYTLTYEIKDDELEVTIKAAVNGWVAFGVTPGGMVGADVVMAWQTKDATPKIHLSDRKIYTFANPPSVDTQTTGGTEDWTLISGSQEANLLTVSMKRKLVTEDSQDLPFQRNKPSKLVWSMHTSAAPCDNNGVIQMHTQRGIVSLDLSKPPDAQEAPAPPAGSTPRELVFNQHVVSPDATSYFCKNFDLTTLATNPIVEDVQYAVRFDPVVDNVERIHHIVVYGCAAGVTLDPALPAYDCGEGMPAGCGELVYAWAVGGGPFILPDTVHLGMGATKYRFLVAQHHYDNPGGVTGQVDSSGVRIYTQAAPRTAQMGFLKLGVKVRDISIPDDPRPYSIGNQCDLPAGGGSYNVFGAALHMHGAGREVSSVFTRATGGEAKIINNHYDFELQEIAPVVPEIAFQGGDSILTTCTYENTGTTVIVGGDETSNEMCVVYLAYYPKVQLTSCQTTNTAGVHGTTTEQPGAPPAAICSESDVPKSPPVTGGDTGGGGDSNDGGSAVSLRTSSSLVLASIVAAAAAMLL